MSKHKSSEVSRNPPNEAALLVMLGVKLHMSRWGIVVVGVVLCVLAALLCLWMTPEEANQIIATIMSGL